MYLQKLSIVNFKNYTDAELKFSEKINCFVGNNGAGKTNLLDAIYYLSFCKSFINPVDSQNIHDNDPFFVINGDFGIDDKTENVYCGLKRNQRKQFKLNKKEYSRFADHIGLFPLVMISPFDTNLIYDGSEERRKFIDTVISQYNKNYLNILINYNKVLLQRNTLLKQMAEKNFFDRLSLDIWNEQIIEYGNVIHSIRKNFTEEFSPVFKSYYEYITENKETIELKYNSQLNEADFSELLEKSLEKDRATEYTHTGIHKDDLELLISGNQLKKFGSQGQQKSFVIALKLAQFEITKNAKGLKPILLFDDIFDKLDNNRVKQIMKLVSDNSFGQIFITDTQKERINYILKHIDSECFVFDISDGKVKLVES